jgi:DNA-binding NarL/FixJ family response regulator
MPINLMVAMWNDVFRERFIKALEEGQNEIDLKVACQCGLLTEVEELYLKERPSILIIDAKFQSHSYSYEIISSLLQKDSLARIIVVTGDYKNDIAMKLLKLGVRGYLIRNCEVSEMMEIIVKVYNNETVIGDNFFKKKIEEPASHFISF